MGNGIV